MYTGNGASHYLKQMLYILAVLILMSSCATILNMPYTNVKVYTTESSKIIYRYDTIKTVNNEANLWIERKNKPVSIIATSDANISKTIEIKPKNSFMYWVNIPYTYGIGLLVDMNNPKRYSYPKRIYINSADTISKWYRYNQADNEGELYLHLSVPYINLYRMIPENESLKVGGGFWGFTVGLDYYYSRNKFINAGFSGGSDFFLPVPAAVDISGEYELMSSIHFSLSENYKFRRFTVGYGLSYARNTWDFRYYNSFNPPPPTREPVKKSYNAFGLIFPIYFQMGHHFNIGVVYRPTFYRPNITNKFGYEHLISVDFAWKIRVMK
jgi:hypothetical protein